MARIIHDGRWYRQLSHRHFYETEFETIVGQHAGPLFPDHYLVPFKVTVHSDLGSARPDLALIRHDFREWWVVEVELTSHSLYGHVIPQIAKFRTGEYGSKHADYIRSKAPDVEREALQIMMKGEPPRVLVVAEARVAEWEEGIQAHGGHLIVFEPYRSDDNRNLFRTIGRLPEREAELLSVCRRDPQLGTFLIVDSPGALRIDKVGAELEIICGEVPTNWRILETGSKVWLLPEGPDPYPANGEFELVHHEGSLTLRVLS